MSKIYCNSCQKQIPRAEETYCTQCGVPICKGCANHCLTCEVELCDSCYAENNFRCEECFKPENMFSTIRRSHIEQYAGCPYSLYLQLILGITPPMGKHAQLGVIVHALIEDIQVNNTTLTASKAELERLIQEWNINTDDEYSIITMDLEELGHTCLDNFFKLRSTLRPLKALEENVKFVLEEDLPTISCTIDRIEEVGKDLHIRDWKTGMAMSGKKLITDLQPPLYIYGVYKEFGVYPKTFTLNYLKTGKEIVYNLQEGEKVTYEVKTTRNTYILDIEEALGRTRKILKGIKNNKFDIPNMATHVWRCKSLCWYGISGKCTGVQTEQWKVLNDKYNETKDELMEASIVE